MDFEDEDPMIDFEEHDFYEGSYWHWIEGKRIIPATICDSIFDLPLIDEERVEWDIHLWKLL